MDAFVRMTRLVGSEAMARLARARVAVFGVGGVGGYVAEALGRCGVGAIDLFDHDQISLTNINRQIIATHSVLGQDKVEIMAARLRDINPDARVEAHRLFYLPDTADQVNLRDFDYIADAVDTVTAKLLLATRANACGVPVISAMGAGNRLDPGQLRVADIFETSVCPLARIMRKELRRRGVDHLKVVYSLEEAMTPAEPAPAEDAGVRRDTPGSTAFVPPVMGLMMAREIVLDLIKMDELAENSTK